MFIRKLYFKIKRFFFKKITGMNPEDIKKMSYIQMYLDKVSPKNIQSYNSYLRSKYESF